jgi:general secretion pathway protein D
LDIQQEVSTIGETDGSTGNPIISQRTISSSVAVDSGETIALGGLFEQRSTRGSAGIPGLSRQPIFGGLFGRKSRTDNQTELLVLITPRIVNSGADARRITRSLRNRMENIRLDDATLSSTINMPQMRTQNSADLSTRAAASNRIAATQSDVQAAVQTALLAPATTVASNTSGSHFAYLGAFGSEAAARQHWDGLVQSNGSALSGMTPKFPQSGDLVSVAVGPMTANQATQVCVAVRTDCYSSRSTN